MHALIDLVTTDYGLMSLIGIAFMIGMGVFFVRFFIKNMQADEAAERAAKAGTPRA